MKKGIFLNHKFLDHETIIASNRNSKNTFTSFESNTIKFYQEWFSDKPSFVLQTSGSTGKPKEITFKREQLVASANNTIERFQLKKKKVALVCLSTDLIAGKMMMVRALENDMTIYAVEPSGDPFSGMTTKIHFCAVVPIQLKKLLSKINKYNQYFDSDSTVIVGGAEIDQFIIEKSVDFKGNIFHTYGMTETASHIAVRHVFGNNTKSTFQALPNVTLGQDARACLKINGAITDFKWVQTNDLVELSDKNEFKWLGRIDNVINSGGVKIILAMVPFLALAGAALIWLTMRPRTV